MYKITKLIKHKPGILFFKTTATTIEKDLTLKEIIKNYISIEELDEKTPKNLLYGFEIETTEGDNTKSEIYHIGEAYPRERILEEFGEDSLLYQNIIRCNFDSAVKYISNNFGGVNKGDKIISPSKIIEILENIKETSDKYTSL